MKGSDSYERHNQELSGTSENWPQANIQKSDNISASLNLFSGSGLSTFR
jgi:hypothetical protein